MSDPGRKSVLARKADLVRMRGPRKATQLDFGTMPVKALNRAVKRAGVPYDALEIEPRDEAVSWDQTLAEVTEMLPEGGLLIILEGAERARGILHLHQSLLDALIEVQTTGHVDAVEGPARPATSIDAALSRDFIDLMLSALDTELEDMSMSNVVMRLHFGTVLTDRRQLPLLAPERGFHVFRCKADVAQGTKSGTLILALPGTQTAAASWPKRGPDKQWRAGFHRTLSQARLRFDSILFRREIGLNAALALKPGDVIPFDAEMMQTVRIEDALYRAVLKGRLGQTNGTRALRLTLGAIDRPIDEDAPVEAAPNFANPDLHASPHQPSATAPDLNAPDTDPLPPLGADGGEASLAPLGEPGDLPPLDNAGGLPALEAEGGLPPLGDGGLPPLGDDGGLPPLGDGGLPPLGGDGGLPPLGDGGLPPLGEGGLPPLGGGLPDLPETGTG
ncbi:MAG: FliM/FliN family flagellar motor switch protein [Pseudomonadota bacterium]